MTDERQKLDNLGRQKSVVCHGKVGQLLLADKSWPTRKSFPTRSKTNRFVVRNSGL